MLHNAQPLQVVYLPHNEQAVWEDANHIKRRNISPVFEGLKLEWIHLEFPPGTSLLKNFSQYHNRPHPEKKVYILVIKGILEIRFTDKTYRLEKGDSIYYEENFIQALVNPEQNPTEFYAVIRYT